MKRIILLTIISLFATELFAQSNAAGTNAKPSANATKPATAPAPATKPATTTSSSTTTKAEPSYGLNNVSAETIGVINWDDSMEATRANLEERFGEASIEGEKVVANGLFGGEPSVINCIYEAGSLSRIEFKILFAGEGKNAYIGYENAYATLMEMFGSPTTIDVYSGERLWKFGDGGVVKVLNKRTTKEGKRKNTGSISGQGELKGQLRTQGREGGKTEGKFILDLNQSKDAEGLVWDGEQTYTEIELETTILFIKDGASLNTAAANTQANSATTTGTTAPANTVATNKPATTNANNGAIKTAPAKR